MAIVHDRHNNKPVQVDPKTGKPLPPAVPPRSVSPSLEESSGGFFNSLFSSKNKKKMAAMEAPPPVLKASGSLSDKETQEVEVIKLLISSYFSIVRRTVIDIIPKAIMLNLVQLTKEGMQRELLENLYKTDELDDLLKESDATVERRKYLQNLIDSLRKSEEIVTEMG